MDFGDDGQLNQEGDGSDGHQWVDGYLLRWSTGGDGKFAVDVFGPGGKRIYQDTSEATEVGRWANLEAAKNRILIHQRMKAKGDESAFDSAQSRFEEAIKITNERYMKAFEELDEARETHRLTMETIESTNQRLEAVKAMSQAQDERALEELARKISRVEHQQLLILEALRSNDSSTTSLLCEVKSDLFDLRYGVCGRIETDVSLANVRLDMLDSGKRALWSSPALKIIVVMVTMIVTTFAMCGVTALVSPLPYADDADFLDRMKLYEMQRDFP